MVALVDVVSLQNHVNRVNTVDDLVAVVAQATVGLEGVEAGLILSDHFAGSGSNLC